MPRSALLGTLALLLALSGCSSESSKPTANGKRAHVAYVTNGIADFWVIAEKGAKQGGKEFNADVEVRMPPKGVADQKKMVQELLTTGIDGIAISPIDSANQGELLQEIASNTNLITHDSDAPDSPRLCYVGMDNYSAGRMCGELVKEALPDGGSVMIFVGRLGQVNAQHRRQGVIDVLLGREPDSSRYDQPGTELKGDKYTVLDTRTDDFDRQRAKQLAQDAIALHGDLGCMVGLFEYNPPILLDVVQEAGKEGTTKVVGFDENEKTLQAILDGKCQGTIVQNPYEYGRKSVEVLAALARGDQSLIPKSKFIDIPAQKIVKDNAQKFWDELNERTGKQK